MLVVVAVEESRAAAAERALAAEGADVHERRALSAGRLLLVAATPGAEAVVMALRASGWRAVARPEGGAHLDAWRGHTAPVVIDGRFSVCFPWSEFDRGGAPPAIEVDPGRSFGTGAHPSTRLLLEEVARRVRPGDRVLDVGCGSGVLALAAAHLGAAAVATDIDPAALAATTANAEWNGLAVTVSSDLPGDRFDAVVANIGADPLVGLAPSLVERVAAGGWVGLSGISPAQVSVVAAAYRAAASRTAVSRAGTSRMAVEARTDGEWAAVIVTSA